MAKYSEEFKIKLVTEYLNGNLGYKSLAKKYNMPSQTPIQDWIRAYKTKGIEGLKPRLKGRPSMSKNTNKPKKKEEKKLTREEELERENELLRLENSLPKKNESFSRESGCLPRKAQAKVAFELKEEGFRLKDILLVVGIPEATYHYHVRKIIYGLVYLLFFVLSFPL
ncbi:helix-turn-helix domain-containing protein [Alteribacillus bidgolensis]|nr:helix-turn-helix domain-containing protein [Alteribacillus bidgolensis]